MGCFDFNHAPQRLTLVLNNTHSACWEGIVASDTYKQVFGNVEEIGENVDICLYHIQSLERNPLVYAIWL